MGGGGGGGESAPKEAAAGPAMLPKLIDVQWKLGVAAQSSECRRLMSPFVEVQLTAADAHAPGRTTTRTVEMTLAQFHDFARQVESMCDLVL